MLRAALFAAELYDGSGVIRLFKEYRIGLMLRGADDVRGQAFDRLGLCHPAEEVLAMVDEAFTLAPATAP